MTNYRITFIDKSGETRTEYVTARNAFEAVQIAGAFGGVVLSVEDLDR